MPKTSLSGLNIASNSGANLSTSSHVKQIHNTLTCSFLSFRNLWLQQNLQMRMNLKQSCDGPSECMIQIPQVNGEYLTTMNALLMLHNGFTYLTTYKYIFFLAAKRSSTSALVSPSVRLSVVKPEFLIVWSAYDSL